jgi:ribonuclease D
VGLNTILANEFDIQVDKKLQKADWGRRPLPEDYRAYARTDTLYLKQLRDLLHDRLREKDLLSLAAEDFERMTRSTGSDPSTVEEQLWHVTGARDLTSRQAAILLELLRWREHKARTMNRPPFKVISTDELYEIAFTQVTTIHNLKAHAHISERLADRFGEELIHAVEVGQKKPPIRPPVNGKCDPAMRTRLDRLKEFRKKAAAPLEVESDIVLPKDLLYQLAENPPADWQEFEQAMSLYPWRLAHYGADIFQAIHPLLEARCL